MSELDRKDIQELRDVLKRPLFFPDNFKSWLSDYIALNVPKMPLSHVYGYKLQDVKSDYFGTGAFANVTSTSYSDADDGEHPVLTGVANGFYIVLFGARRPSQTAPEMFMAVSINGSTPIDNDAVWYGQNNFSSTTQGRAVIVEARSDNNNKFALKYRLGAAGSASIFRRYMILMRVVEHE
jgi:hypothetical protein